MFDASVSYVGLSSERPGAQDPAPTRAVDSSTTFPALPMADSLKQRAAARPWCCEENSIVAVINGRNSSRYTL
jgi:hypothetical protein